ncbi:1-hydroxycarotenoid 3,4-desaturase CrtD [Phreatobacter oligotrophus]|uniref:1-hydroxycarotenoid 3,4-desaturase CrtD n=1 Tax=Phreatobacter oligotrophus TaxID=1122261 RepID=UPI00235329CB|nr:1-hydroxycarotenoid 3,4-desaturase CrtD [Phreatobacter oligotrophus]MBX9991783.1 phytoene desaturase [Phreatobacter oligotrophus]
MQDRVVIVGAGIAGLTAAMLLAHRGCAVTLVEASDHTGGKIRAVETGAGPLDSGPTVFTMRPVFEALFSSVGESLGDHLALTPLDVLARHHWPDGSTLDLFADPARSAEAIAAVAGPAEADGFRRFCADAARVYRLLDAPFMQTERPSMLGLTASLGLGGLAIRPFETLWSVLGSYFRDPRLRQLFGRYATYCGSSPFAAPATLMLIAHAEQEGVWSLPGGMQDLARAVTALALARGAELRSGCRVAEIVVRQGRAAGIRLATGEEIAADVVIHAGDVGALASGLLGPEARRAVPAPDPALRSLSAVTWCLAARAEGFPLAHHTVFFSADYAAEFAALAAGSLPDDPTIYVCAPDRSGGSPQANGAERLFCLVNAPARGDDGRPDPGEIDPCETRMMQRLAATGLTLSITDRTVTTPADFARRFPGTSGALYGSATHGAMASFRRPGSRSAIPGLYLAGGSVHPGAGVPMAATSGRLAASAVMADLTSRSTSRRTAMPGGMLTR